MVGREGWVCLVRGIRHDSMKPTETAAAATSNGALAPVATASRTSRSSWRTDADLNPGGTAKFTPRSWSPTSMDVRSGGLNPVTVGRRFMAERMVCVLNRVLMVAKPSVEPSMRTVVFAPLVAPLRAAGTPARITLLSWELLKPMPNPYAARRTSALC